MHRNIPKFCGCALTRLEAKRSKSPPGFVPSVSVVPPATGRFSGNKLSFKGKIIKHIMDMGCMCIYIYIYITYVSIYIYIYEYIYIYMNMNVYIYIYEYISIYEYIYI